VKKESRETRVERGEAGGEVIGEWIMDNG